MTYIVRPSAKKISTKSLTLSAVIHQPLTNYCQIIAHTFFRSRRPNMNHVEAQLNRILASFRKWKASEFWKPNRLQHATWNIQYTSQGFKGQPPQHKSFEGRQSQHHLDWRSFESLSIKLEHIVTSWHPWWWCGLIIRSKITKIWVSKWLHNDFEPTAYL